LDVQQDLTVYGTGAFTNLTNSGNVLIGGTNVFGKTVSFSNFAGGGTQNFTASSGATANGLKAGFSIYSTFEATPGDNNPRRTVDILGGFNAGNWGNEYLSFGVGTGAANDAQAQTTERMRITGAGNVGIGTSSPSASAILDAQSTTKGVRMPNMTTTQKNAIASPAAGLMVFDTTLAKLCVYSGSAWQTITSI
jgi:hypothetical protein